MNPDGSGRKQLTASQAAEKRPEVSADGKFIVYVSNNGKQNIWRMDIDGGRQTQLTNGDGESYPVFTPDSHYVFFNSTADGSLWKVPVEGGEAVKVIDDKVMRVSISPDGSKLAYFGKKDGQRKILVRTLPGLEITQDFNAYTSQANPPKIIWENDGKALIYVSIDDKLVGNLYRQSLNATQPEAITQFTYLQIFDFAYSPNGDQIALVRGNWKHDTVLLTGFR